ncbi:MAG: hypothetical protein L3J23_04345 [Flavobacteriaceae bacterium]|nr:hypothetical protein [Flavobacteriaceae bacterium]
MRKKTQTTNKNQTKFQKTNIGFTFLTDANGKIVFVDLTNNQRVRPEPDTFLKVIDALK